MQPDRHVEAGTAGPGDRTGHRTQAPGGVEPGHHGTAESPFDRRRLDVHGDVTGARAVPEKEQPDRDGRHRLPATGGDAGQGQSERGQSGPERHRAGRAQPVRQHPGGRQRQQGARGERQQQQTQPARGEVEGVPGRRHPGEPRGDGQTVEPEDDGDPGPGRGDVSRHGRWSRRTGRRFHLMPPRCVDFRRTGRRLDRTPGNALGASR
ncbi:hypothetical protein Pen02_71830 [Plantactinospora endophytica]|uniref:Uncharacterized protein n=1 Tax=Plantactinospora endophytica TaxID=673535 RepID=A0ABQ4EBY6_9ACTN|nr:hypothetical protein Pen02_71830 [Plantactinospora endophytica]